MPIAKTTLSPVDEILRSAAARAWALGSTGAPRPSSGADPRVFMFQKLITVLGVPTAQIIQPFCQWFDGGDVTMVQFKVEILGTERANHKTQLILESSPYPEEDPSLWTELGHWDSVPSGGFEIVTAVSDSGVAAAGAQFSRYIRWRVCSVDSIPVIALQMCFRIKAIIGSTFTQWPETPRKV